MIYKIILASLKEAEKFRYSNGGLVRIKKEGHNEHDVEAVMGLFSGLRRKDYPTFLEECTNRWGHYVGEMGFEKGPVDEEGVIIKEGEVLIVTYVSEKTISVSDFHKLSYEFGNKALEAVEFFNLKEKGLVDDNWISRIQKALVKIKSEL